jgi:DNA polymerase-3 subunit gamma/tau
MTFYLKYRPQTIAELDLQSVRESLTKIIASGRIPHAFLFSGPKGTGKTSAARILAKVINCQKPLKSGEPCNHCEHCLAITKGSHVDVLEMDAASNRGIDDIRALRESIALAPVYGKKRIYIIDEVHMLTLEAANAFLKTLEEPPQHALFILATTNPEKLPETVRSRLTNVVFRKASAAEIARQLQRVIKGEKLKVEKGVVELIAKHADGSFRDAVKILEQLTFTQQKINLSETQEFLSQKGGEREFLALLAEGKSKEALLWLEEVSRQGHTIKVLIDNLIEVLREALLAKEGLPDLRDLPEFSQEETLKLLKLLLTARQDLHYLPVEQLALEMVVAKWCAKHTPNLQEKEKEGKKKDPPASPIKPLEIQVKENKKTADLQEQLADGVWQEVLVSVRAQNTSVEALLRATRPMGFDGKYLTLGVYYQFHKERLEMGENKRTLEEVLTEIVGNPVRVTYTLTERDKSAEKEEINSVTEAQDNDIIKVAKEVFG